MTKKLIGLRLSEGILDKLQEIAEEENTSTNKIAVHAIREWLQQNSFTLKFPFIIITSNIFVKTLELLDEEQLYKLNDMFVEVIEEMFIHIIDSPLSKITLKDFYSIVPLIFGKNGLRWFDNLELYEKDNIIVLKGIHHLGSKFSFAFKNVAQTLMKKYYHLDLREGSVRYVQNTVYFEFKIKK